MGRTENQKLKLLYLKELFERQSDEEHLLSMQDILDALAVRGIRAERKSVYDDILCLQQFGMDIVTVRGRKGGYFLASRTFELPELKLRVVNVVDLMKLQPHTEHPHGLTDEEYDGLFTKDKPIIFAYHGYPTLVHELTYRRHNKNLHVRGYKEEGTITTPFDMRVLNDIDRFDLVIDTVRRLPQLGNRGAYLVQKMQDKLVEHRQYIRDNGVDLPEVRAWKWNDGKGVEV